MIQGIYEELVTQLVSERINGLNKDLYFINKSKIDKEEASIIISRHLSKQLKAHLMLSKENIPSKIRLKLQIKLSIS